MLCDHCQKRKATVHINRIVDDVVQSSDLCQKCAETELPELKALVAARCHYCGGHPCAAFIDFLAPMTGVQQMNYMCIPCSMEHSRYIQQRLPQIDSGLSQQKQLAALRRLNVAADKHMRQWVSQRGSRGCG